MRRREFMAAISGAAVIWPFAANAQQLTEVPTIGFLGQLTPSAMSKWTVAFVQRLRELGWVEGRTVAIEYRWAEQRALRGSCCRVSPAKGRCHRHGRNRSN
jgi:putative ABC transport system substrate-binding protein